MYFWLLSSKLISHLSDPVCWKGFLYSCCFQILPTYCTLHELRFQHGPQREQTSAFVSQWAKPEVKSTFSKPEISTSGGVRMLFFPTQHSSSCELWFSPDGEAAEFCCHILKCLRENTQKTLSSIFPQHLDHSPDFLCNNFTHFPKIKIKL